jgi:hypothetical protein
MSESYSESVDPAESSNQLQFDDTLVDRGVDDVLDEGFIPADNYGPGEGFGTTADEARQGESLDQRVAQEEPDIDPFADGDEDEYEFEVGRARAGRLVDAGWRL